MGLFDQIIGLIAPHRCLGCGIEGALVCARCEPALDAPSLAVIDGLDSVFSAMAYVGLAKELVHCLKFQGAQAAAKVMARHMAPLLTAYDRPSTLLVPVPTATSRMRQRGYDQAVLLARELSRLSSLPCRNVLARHGQTHQVGASREQRLKQLDGAFRLSKPSVVRGAHIVLVDDVLTTGATLSAAASVLAAAGAKRIDAVVFARAERATNLK